MNEPTKESVRCSAALGYLRLVWGQLVDAGCGKQFKERMMSIASDIKLALGGKEKDGQDV